MSARFMSFAFGFVMVAGPLCAQAPLFRELGPELPATPVATGHSADFDLDGDRDLLAISSTFSSAFSVLHNDGTGRFTAGPSAVPPGPFQLGGIAVADFDGDGDADVAYARDGLALAHRIDLLLNVGGAFVPTTGFVASAFCLACKYGVFALDADQDGDQDLAIGSWGSPSRLFLNQGGASFVELPGALAAASTAAVLANAGDVDGDGDEDLYAAGTNGQLRALLNGGAGVFAASAAFQAAAFGAVFGYGDFDGDGRRDAVATVHPLYGPGAETFVSFATGAPVVVASVPSVGGAAFAFGLDIDADGVDEVVRTRSRTFEFAAVGSASPSFSWPASSQPAPEAVDVDGDGDLDVLYQSAGTGRRVLRNRGDGSFVDAAVLPAAAFDAFSFGMSLLIDVDGDGALDLAGVSTAPSGAFALNAGGLNVALNDGLGAFPAAVAAVAGAPAQQHSGPTAAADFNLDGNGDFAFHAGALLTLRLGDGAGGFSTTSIPTGVIETAVETVAADVDQDGDADLLVAARSPASGRATLYRNVGGAFAPPVVLHAATGADVVADLAVFDADQDGDLDAALAGGAGACALLVNDGVGNFSATFPFGVAFAATVAAGDVDADGDVDVLLEDAMWLRAGAGYVVGPPAVPSIPIPPSVNRRRRLFDLNGDGTADLLAPTSWRAALGGGAFGPDEAIRPFPEPVSPPPLFWDVADVDGDGDLDLFDRYGAFRWNTTRQLARGAAPAIGRTGSVEIHGLGGAPYDLVLSLAAAHPPVALGPWGTLYVDPATAVLAASDVLDANGAGAAFFAVPNLPALAGYALYWQAALPSVGRLTGGVRTEIVRL